MSDPHVPGPEAARASLEEIDQARRAAADVGRRPT